MRWNFEKVQPIVVDVENREEIKRTTFQDFFRFATCCKWKGLFVEADLVAVYRCIARACTPPIGNFTNHYKPHCKELGNFF
jgi:hypothetical protein